MFYTSSQKDYMVHLFLKPNTHMHTLDSRDFIHVQKKYYVYIYLA